MTIYYVDPVSGSNSNNGTAWGTAWKWLPGNGTALVAGDEVRFAKSPERTSASVAVGRQYVSASGLGTVQVSIGTTAVASLAGVTVSGSQLLIPANTAVPANTQIGRWAFSRSQTTLNGVAFLIVLKGIPTSQIGGNLKICLCSDAAGTTIIATLNGPTCVTYNTSERALCTFLHNSATTLNLSIASIAVYSVAAFTTENFASAIDRDSFVYFTPLQTGTSFFKPSAVLKPNSQANTQRALDYRAPDFCMITNASGSFATPQALTVTNNTVSQTTTQYDPMPTALMPLVEAALNFSGSAVSRIRLRGGFNTGTNTQDGYTNLAIDSITWSPRKGSFVFSGGGQYLDFERFISPTAHLVYYDYAVATINSFRLYDCTVGTDQVLANHSEPGALAASEANTTLTVTEFYTERCRLKTFAPVRRWWSGRYSATEPYGFASGNLTFGTIDNVDCATSTTNFVGNDAQSLLKVTTAFNVRSSTIGTRKSIVDANNSATFSFLSSSTAPVLFRDMTVVNGGDVQGPTTAGATLAITIQDLTITDTTSHTTITAYFRVLYAKTTTVNGLVCHGSAATAMHYLGIVSSATFYTNNPTGHTITFGGACGTNHSESSSNALTGLNLSYIRPDTTLTFNPITVVSGYRRPGLYIASLQSGETVISGWDGAYAGVGSYTYTAGTYYPNVPRVKFVDCNGRFSAISMPTGSVRVFGGSAVPNDEYKVWSTNLSINSNPFTSSLALYKVTVPAVITDERIGTESIVSNKRITTEDLIVTGGVLTGAATNVALGLSGLFLSPDSTLDLTGLPGGTNSAGFARGGLARKPNGEFVYKSYDSLAYSGAVNVYNKRDIVFQRALRLASLDVMAGTTVTLNLRIRASTTGKYFLLIIVPSSSFSGSLDQHVFRKNIFTSTEDILMSVNFSPSQDGTVDVNVYAVNPMTIKDFTTSVA